MDRVQIDSLNELPYNPRKISSRNLENLKASVREGSNAFTEEERDEGFRLAMTVTVNRMGNRVVGGHQRLKALKALGQDWVCGADVTWVSLEPNSVAEKALNVALNNREAQGDFIQEELDDLLASIKTEDSVRFESLGFEDIDADLSFLDSEAEPPRKPAKNEEAAGEDAPVSNKFKGEPGSQAIHTSDEADGVGDVVDGDVVEPPTPPVDESEMPSEQLFPISYAVTVQQREHVLSAITVAKEKYGFKTNAEALSFVCEEYVAKEEEND